ncbi:hypothetical protein C9374_010319 [Naegleria lovaniensis]|uniref:Peptide-methionine (R)-S-oxide reductase n=1 Tax=Naegleria lovaniensis TaxID=51637 RepID=A0AA88KDR9_NAELO|nr:uncharacterized protein C9374_010319 [Naegleria lovaniensis]KAG2374945.1 hypothetical protein C9374_010319 [Naegleria lovaniensis]
MGYTDQVRQLLKQVETDESVIVEDENQLPPPTVQKTDEEWKKILTSKQYEVLRRAGTEPSFCGGYKTFKDQLKQNQQEEGVFHCSACDAPLFNAKTSFDSGSGWPSFWAPVAPKAIGYIIDSTLGMERVEVVCNSCHSHLGHVFSDGPRDKTKLRYCINAICLALKVKK